MVDVKFSSHRMLARIGPADFRQQHLTIPATRGRLTYVMAYIEEANE
jgi:hypothetical protein